LLEALRDLDHAVHAMPMEQTKPDLLPLFDRIDRLATRLPREIETDLQHYLQRKSYDKARRWLEARATGHGPGPDGP
jgi:hypothetical protein